MRPLPHRILARWRGAPPRRRRWTAALVALLAAWGLGVAAANRPAARARLRAEVRDALAKRLPGAEIGGRMAVDPLFRVHFGPLTLRAGRKGAPPLLAADAVRVRADPWALLAGRVEPASVRLYGVRLVPGERFSELRALAERLRPRPDPKGAPRGPIHAAPRGWPAIHLRGATVVLRAAGRDHEIGPLDASLIRDRAREGEALALAVSHRRGGRAWLRLDRAEGAYRLRAGAVDLGPGVLPPSLAGGPVRWTDGTFTADLALDAAAGGPATGRLRARVDRAWFDGARLSDVPVGPISVDLDAPLELAPADLHAAVRGGHVRLLGAIEATLDAEARLAPGLPFAVALEAPAVEFGALSLALPNALRPPSEAPSPAGPLSARLALSGPLREPAAWAVEAQLDLARLREAARRAPPVPLRSAFTWHPAVEQGTPPAIRIGPENPDFVPLADLPVHVVRAVTTAEDAGFFAHSGFDFEELRNAFAQGAEAGHVVRGASTITQQLAKNLYLSRERTFARKVREAMVAVALEASLPKARLLEIYLNLAEWGPGLWGIGPAARHYFGKPAAALTVREAAFLASIIPNPVRYHAYFTRGALDAAWTERLRVILINMAQAGVLTEDQLLEALDAPLVFANGDGSEDGASGDAHPVP